MSVQFIVKAYKGRTDCIKAELTVDDILRGAYLPFNMILCTVLKSIVSLYSLCLMYCVLSCSTGIWEAFSRRLTAIGLVRVSPTVPLQLHWSTMCPGQLIALSSTPLNPFRQEHSYNRRGPLIDQDTSHYSCSSHGSQRWREGSLWAAEEVREEEWQEGGVQMLLWCYVCVWEIERERERYSRANNELLLPTIEHLTDMSWYQHLHLTK